jgi:hypothetical protein
VGTAKTTANIVDLSEMYFSGQILYRICEKKTIKSLRIYRRISAQGVDVPYAGSQLDAFISQLRLQLEQLDLCVHILHLPALLIGLPTLLIGLPTLLIGLGEFDSKGIYPSPSG